MNLYANFSLRTIRIKVHRLSAKLSLIRIVNSLFYYFLIFLIESITFPFNEKENGSY